MKEVYWDHGQPAAGRGVSSFVALCFVGVFLSACSSNVEIFDPGLDLEDRLNTALQECGKPDPVVIHRLNREEYNRSIQDLFEISIYPAEKFPADPFRRSFDNDASSMRMSPELLEDYLEAAESVVNEALAKSSNLIFSCLPGGNVTPEACARSIISRFGERAYRRPLEDGELDALLALYAQGSATRTFDNGIRSALEGILVSPQFLFRMIRLSPDEGDAGVAALDDFELASRLSFFLWSSIPDSQLFELARDGELSKPAVLRSEISRMLRHPRADALVKNFSMQWLNLQNFEEHLVDEAVFPEFTPQLRDDMRRETELMVSETIQNDLPISTLLTANYSYLNERLASHYGLGGVGGEEFRRVSLVGTPRRGLITQASILTRTSKTNQTSVIRRGVWVLGGLLCDEPEAPPDDFDSASMTGVNRLDNPACASCHSTIDPIGYGLNQYDAIGRFRTIDEAGNPVNSQGVLPNGASFEGSSELVDVLGQADHFQSCFGEKLLTYALGRQLGGSDECVLEKLSREEGLSEMTFSELVQALVESLPFQRQATNDV